MLELLPKKDQDKILDLIQDRMIRTLESFGFRRPTSGTATVHNSIVQGEIDLLRKEQLSRLRSLLELLDRIHPSINATIEAQKVKDIFGL